MTYHVEFSKDAVKTLEKMDKHVAILITAWIRKNLEGCSNPYQYGKGLSANRSGQWRYRIGDYRLIAEIMEERVVVLILRIGHRRDVYDACE
jgi:mRNA interferase RelE/StbE